MSTIKNVSQLFMSASDVAASGVALYCAKHCTSFPDELWRGSSKYEIDMVCLCRSVTLYYFFIDLLPFVLQNADKKMQNADKKMQNADKKMQNADKKIQNADKKMQNADKKR
jgi:peptidoglycan hydrolase CwlO-like protein